jgi:hypothetical protein
MIDENAIGFYILMDGAAPPGWYYQVNCEEEHPLRISALRSTGSIIQSPYASLVQTGTYTLFIQFAELLELKSLQQGLIATTSLKSKGCRHTLFNGMISPAITCIIWIRHQVASPPYSTLIHCRQLIWNILCAVDFRIIHVPQVVSFATQ